jgi:hypothetical protein
MVFTAIVFFIFAALLGLVLLIAILKNKPTPKPVVFIHGIIAALALLMLVTYVALGHTSTLLITSLVLFVLAAIGGITMFTFDMSGKPVPKMLALGHPALAITSIILLIIYFVQLIP